MSRWFPVYGPEISCYAPLVFCWIQDALLAGSLVSGPSCSFASTAKEALRTGSQKDGPDQYIFPIQTKPDPVQTRSRPNPIQAKSAHGKFAML